MFPDLRAEFDAAFVADVFGGVLGAEWEEVGLPRRHLSVIVSDKLSGYVECISSILYNIGM